MFSAAENETSGRKGLSRRTRQSNPKYSTNSAIDASHESLKSLNHSLIPSFLQKRKDKKRRQEPPKQKLRITTNMNLTSRSVMDAALEYRSGLDYTSFPNDSKNSGHSSSRNTSGQEREYYFHHLVFGMTLSMLIICILGVVGNGIVIWLLGFRVQRNPFMTYILNLGIADLGLLISLMLYLDFFDILPSSKLDMVVTTFLPLLTYSAGQFLLTAISIHRCVAVFFPIWHRCHRPPRLTTIVCALMWLLSFLLSTVTCILLPFDLTRDNIQHLYQFIVNAGLCLPLVTISTLALLIKVCFQQRQRWRGKLLTILLLTLAFFLLFAFPFNVILICFHYGYLHGYFPYGAMLLACLNSSVNPIIYFLVGRQRKTRRRESLKMILQRAFKEEEEEGCPEGSPAETQL